MMDKGEVWREKERERRTVRPHGAVEMGFGSLLLSRRGRHALRLAFVGLG